MQMLKTLFVLICLLALMLAGCTTKSKARAQAQKAFEAGQKQAQQAVQAQQNAVTIVGQVRNRIIPWKEGMTVADAINEAVFTGFSDPRLIRLVRGADFLDITPKDLLSKKVNPPVEAGDVIELR